MKTLTDTYECTPENARHIARWLATRGGVLTWFSQDLGDPGKSWTTPYRDESGAVVTRAPHWKANGCTPLHTADPARVLVTSGREVKRFHVGLKRGSGLQVVLTDAASRRVRRAVENAESDSGAPAWYEFDYDTQEAVIFVQAASVPIEQWIKENPS